MPIDRPSGGHRTMTIGQLSKRSGMPARQIRRWENIGLIYSVGRTTSGYRLFDDSALWCIGVIRRLRGLGLTNREVAEIGRTYLEGPGEAVGPLLAAKLAAVRRRLDARRVEIDRVGHELSSFERALAAAQAAGSVGRSWTGDPTRDSSGA